MKISISVCVDRRAALLAGRVLGAFATVEIGPEDMSLRAWTALVGALDLSTSPHNLSNRNVVGNKYCQPFANPTAAAVAAEIDRLVVNHEDESRSRDAKREQMIAEYETGGISTENRIDYGYAWERWSRASHPYVCGSMDRCEARDLVTAPLIAAHNAPHEEQLRLIRAEYDDRLAVRLAEQAESERVAQQAKYAERMRSGYWELETGPYNEKRESAPWCARVSFPNGAKAVYEFGECTGKSGKAGLCRVACLPGDIIAWGQKNLRRPDNSEHTIAQMRKDGSMESIDKTEAFRRWAATQTVSV